MKIYNWIANRKIRTQLQFLVLILVSSFIGIELINYFSFISMEKDKAIEYASNTLNQVEENINKYLDDNRRIALTIAYNNDLQRFLLADDMSARLDFEIKMRNFMDNSKLLKDNIDGISIYFKETYEGYSNVTYGSNPDAYKITGLFDRNKPYYSHLYDSSCYYYIIPVFDTESEKKTFSRIGTLALSLNIKNYLSLLSKMDSIPKSLFIILDQDNTVVACNDETLINTKFEAPVWQQSLNDNFSQAVYKESKCLYKNKQIEGLGWRIISIIPVNELTRDLKRVINISIFIVTLVFALSVLMLLVIINSISSPIKKISNFAAKVGFGSVKERLEFTASNEINSIAVSINEMLDQIEEMTRRVLNTQEKLYVAEIDKKQAELNYLQSQINPHFLYNSLECIRSIADVHSVTEISEISVAMAYIFRYSIKQSENVKIKDELECVGYYFKVIEIRYRNRFSLIMDCDDEILEFPIMKMALQPIVENAVYHGLENKRGKGSVYIQGSLVDNQTVYIKISDNGRGIPKDRLEYLMEMLDQENTNNANITLQRTSIGLINIHNRIKNLYGKQYGITVESVENSGTTVTLRLPKTGGNGNVQSDAD